MTRTKPNLLIVESPGKIKTLRKILQGMPGPGWALEASVGHTTELASDGPKRMGFELEGERVHARYVPRGARGRQVLAKLRKAVASSGKVYLATDPDREGEAIAWHLARQLGLRDFARVTYTQITEAAVRQAIARPRALDQPLVDAQRARQCLDKLVGFEVSPLLWRSTGGKSAGRVQSATLHLVCERERERLRFEPRDYWVLKSAYAEGFEATYEAVPPVDSAPPGVPTHAEALLIAEVARGSPHVVQETEDKPESRNPPPPLITSSLQQTAGARFRYPPKKTMQIAQELYEGVGGKGLITYMRTDAVSLSPEFVSEARGWLAAHAPEALAERPPSYRVQADAQGAHEAIRPTSASLTPEDARKLGLSREQLDIYTLVWQRAIASQCKPARLSRARITIDCAGTRWVARGGSVIDPGYLRFWKNVEDDSPLPRVSRGQRLGLKDVKVEAKTTQPPSRYSEPKLVQLMEKKGIGRPSTYASTIATLKERDYVILEKGLIAPTPLGMETDQALGRAIPELVDAEFTARMEESLDRIADGSLDWERWLTGWSSEYLVGALVRARAELAGVARVPGKAAKGRTASGRLSGRRRSAAARKPPPEEEAKLEGIFKQAQAADRLPVCPQGHGPLSPRLSRKGAVYWKCPHSGCEAFAWHQEYSDHRCPACGARMATVPSAKVVGGHFLKCARPEAHPEEVILFRSRRTGAWELPRRNTKKSPAGDP